MSVLLLAAVSMPASADIVNSGFEDSAVGTSPIGWSTDAAADRVVVSGTETGATFPVYADYGISVAPWKGDQMLRLGTPKRVAESQNKGANRVSQTFVPDAAELRVALRLYSFEFRGDDRIIVDVKDSANALATFPVADASGSPFTFPGLTGSARSCSATPCRLVIDVGNRSDFLRSDWQEIVIRNLPTSRPVTLSVSVEGGANQGHATWMYVDGDPNHPPVAAFTYSPGSEPGTIVQEGDFVAFNCENSSDADGDALSCGWRATAPSIGELTAEGKNAFFLFPDDDTISMELTVSDGRSSSTTTRTISIVNGAPLIAALDRVEVIEGGTGHALCRYLDPGVFDTHTVALSVAGVGLTTEQRSENDPTLASGYGRAVIDATGLAPGTYAGSCTVTDNDGLPATDAFSVVVVSGAEVQDREIGDDDSIGDAARIPGGQTILTALQATTDVDVFEIVSRDLSALPVGAEVNVMIDVPADYDVVLFSRNSNAVNAPFVSAPFVTAPFVSAPFVSAPFVTAPFVTAPFVSAPFVSAPFVTAPFVSAPFVSAQIKTSPFVSAGFSFENFPLSQVGLAAPDGSQISGVDIGLGELGAYNLGALENENLTVKALSAQLGNRSEHILVRVGPGEDALFLALVSQDGTLATAAPASITVEVAKPPSQRQILGANCVGSPLVTPATTTPEVLHEPEGAEPLTLIVTQAERFEATWGESVLAGLDEFLNHTAVLARVISVPSALYDEADTDTCSVAKQNAVALGIKAIIQAELEAHPSIRYLQIIGGPDIVPHYYSPDETTISYEGLFAGELWMKPGKPLAVALAEGHNPTDAFYADAAPQDFRGRALFLEDIPIGRLGERPAEIRDAAATFVAQDGESPVDSILATGYDFFKDGSERTADVLAGIAPVQEIINDAWTADDIRCKYLGSGASGCGIPDFSALNAHMSYNALLSAAGFASADQSEVVASTESTGLLFGRTTLTIGCHSGLSFPDAWAIPQAQAGLSFDPGRDWGQETGDWIGPITYGIGDDTVADRGTEGIVTLVSEELVDGASLGDALVRAKQRYATGLFDFGVYDEKSVIGLGLFGMPQKRVSSAAPAPAPAPAMAGIDAGTLSGELLENGTARPFSFAIDEQSNARGTWYTLDGEAQGVFGRPLLPATQLVDAREVAAGETRIHGVALRGGAYEDFVDVDPVFPTPQHDWTIAVDEPQPCVETTSPTQVAVATLLESTERTLQSLIVQSGQFRCTHLTDGKVKGEMRIFDELTLEALHPSSAGFDSDFQPPTVVRQDIVADPDSNDVVATLDATDANDLREIVGLVFADADGLPGGPGTVTAYSTGDISGLPGPHRLVLANARDQRLAFQYIDGAGNLLMKSLKGTLMRAIEVDILNTMLSFTGPTTIEVFVGGYEGLDAPSIEIDFGDGQPPRVIDLASDPLPDGVSVTLQPPEGTSGSCDDVDVVCDGVIAIVNDFGAVGPNGVTITVTVRAIGAVGSDTAVLSRFCDPVGDASFPNADIVGCAFKATGTRVEFDLYVDGVIANDVQYRLALTQYGALFKFFDGGKVTSPTGVKTTVTRLGTNGLRFAFDAGRLGWNGTTPILYQESTQSGVPGTPNEGFPDETAIKTGYP